MHYLPILCSRSAQHSLLIYLEARMQPAESQGVGSAKSRSDVAPTRVEGESRSGFI